MQQKDVALRKRSQIAKANKTMFLYIAAASVLVGASLVVVYFLGQKLVYNEKVLAAKSETFGTLKDNNKVVPDLESAVLQLEANEALASVKAQDDDQTIQVILDALPSDANSFALGASLQSRLLSNVPGATIVTLEVNPVVGLETLTEGASVEDASASTASSNQITFQFGVSGDQNALKGVLNNLEKSIRAIDITSLRIESQGNTQLMTVTASAFYEPAKSIELVDKKVPK